jgi:hypothetical protein
VPFHSKNGYTNVPQCYIIHALESCFSFHSSTLRQTILASDPNNRCSLSATSGCNYVTRARDQYTEQNGRLIKHPTVVLLSISLFREEVINESLILIH